MFVAQMTLTTPYDAQILLQGTYTAVTGTFVVPTPSAPSGGSGTYSAAAWVGIDGDTCDNAILQTGVDFTVDGGEVSYDGEFASL